MAAAVFASPPTGSYDEALSHFTLAESIQPGFYLRNRMFLARTHLALKDKGAARQWAQQVLELAAVTTDDVACAEEARAMLKSL